MGNIKIKRLFLLSGVIVMFGLILFAARGTHVSNFLKRIILPELSMASGRQVIAQKFYINIFPLFIGAKDLRMLDNGNEILHVQKVKGYIELSGLFRKELVLRRVVLSKPFIKSEESELRDIIEKVKGYLSLESRFPLKVIVRSVAADSGEFVFGYRDAAFTGSGFNGEAVLDVKGGWSLLHNHAPRVNFTLGRISSKVRGWPELSADVKGSIAFTRDAIDVRSLQIGFIGSRINASGVYPAGTSLHPNERPDSAADGNFQMHMNMFMDSFRKAFGLKNRGEGVVYADGSVKVIATDIRSSIIEMKVEGGFYIQTLMELLKVKERVEGKVDFSGDIKGPLNGLRGSANAHLTDGNLFGVEVKDLRSAVSYSDKVLNFKDGKAALYNGSADAEASVAIFGPSNYSLDVRFSGADSPPVLDLIGWKPDIPFGKVKGRVTASGGGRFNPSGWFEYESNASGEDVLGRVKRVKGLYSLRDGLLTISDAEAVTAASTLTVNGGVDIPASGLALNVFIKTSDLADLTLPYLRGLSGSGEFSGTVTGKFADPVIRGDAKMNSVYFDGYYFGDVSGMDIDYRKDIIKAKKISSVAERENQAIGASVSGSIRFPDAKKIFDFKKPFYELAVSSRNADLEKIIKFVYRKPLKAYPKGSADVDFSITGAGPSPVYSGLMHIKGPGLGNVTLDSASLSFFYDYSDFRIRDAVFKNGASDLRIYEAVISGNDRISFKAAGVDISTRDIPVKIMPFDARISFNAEGRGTLDNPEIELKGALRGQRFADTDAGDGNIKASLKNRTLLVDVALFNGNMTFKGKAELMNDMPWTARLDLRGGRYDFLLNSLLKDKPEDLLINMSGYADMSGNRDHFSVSAVISRLNMTLYGNSFANDDDIRIVVRDKDIILPMAKMRSGTTSFNVHGNVGLDRGYDLVLEGSSSLSPVKGFFKRVDTIRGDADFVFAVTGDWTNPRVSGGLTISNAVFGLKGSPYRISAINGYLFVDENRVVIQKLSGKAGGGDIDISGIAYLQKLRMQRFYMDAVLNNIDFNMSRDLSGSFNGNILYKGSLDSQTISGEIRINRARYRERVEWKSWLLKTKAIERPKGEMSALDKTALNIRVYGFDAITIDNNIARAALKVDMLLRGTVSNPVVFGRIESDAGAVYFRNNEFRILKASADFSDPRRINPVMEIVAETSLKGYNIRMNLEGQMDHFSLALLSDPPLEEMDILSLLTVGRFGKELKGIEGGIGAGEAASFLTGKMQDIFEERARTLTGLDRLEVDPYVSKTTGTVNPRVTVSKRLLSDKLFVTYSSAVGSAENNVLKLEYILGKNISLVGVRDEKGSVGGDVKFRFEFK